MNDTNDRTPCTLNAPHVAELLARLFTEAEVSDQKLRQMFGAPLARGARAAHVPIRTRTTASSTAARESSTWPWRPKRRSSSTCSLGYPRPGESSSSGRRSESRPSTSRRAFVTTGGGRLIGTELEPTKNRAGASQSRRGGPRRPRRHPRGRCTRDAGTAISPTRSTSCSSTGTRRSIPRVLDLVAPRLRRGACLVADNADASPDYVARVRAPTGEYLSMSFSKDVELSIKV